MSKEKCNLDDLRGKVGPWLDSQHIREISLIGNNRLSVLFMDNITEEFELQGCSTEDLESFLKEMGEKGIIIQRLQPGGIRSNQ